MTLIHAKVTFAFEKGFVYFKAILYHCSVYTKNIDIPCLINVRQLDK